MIMTKKKLTALLMVGMLGMNANFSIAETREITASTNHYFVSHTRVGIKFYSEGDYYGTNDFIGSSCWDGSDENVIVAAQTLVASADPEEGNRCPAEYKEVIGHEYCEIDEEDFPNVIANMYRTTGVIFSHYYQIAEDLPDFVYSQEVY